MDGDLFKINKLTDAESWSPWKFQVKVLLNASEAFDVVSGDHKRPVLIKQQGETDEQAQQRLEVELKAWKKIDCLAQKLIATSVGQQPLMHIMNCNTSNEMWQKLLNIYEQKTETSVHILQQKFYAFVMDPCDSIASHISKLEDLVQRLKELNEPVSDSMLITKILMTLPSEYGHFHSAWESTATEDRTLQKLTARLMVEETRINQVFESGTNAMTVRKFKSRRPGICYKCRQYGHWKKDCPAKMSNSQSKSDVSEKKGEAFISDTISVKTRNDCRWYMDSGASDHMCNNRNWFANYLEIIPPLSITIGNGKTIYALGKGDINILSFDEKHWLEKHLADVLYVPDIGLNLFSSGCALDKGLKMISDRDKCKFFKDDRIVAVGVRSNRLFEMKFKVIQPNNKISSSFAASCNMSLDLWHQRMSHQNIIHLKKFLKQANIKFTDNCDDFFCESCVIGKQHRSSFPTSLSKTVRPAEIIHSDVCGPMQIKSIGGSRYFLLFKDDFSHYRQVFFLKQKSEVKNRISEYVKSVKVNTGYEISVLRSDNGTEYTNNDVNNILKASGVQHQKTVPYSPEENGSAEREMRTIVEAARTILHAKNLPLKLWAEAVNTAVYVLNRTGTSTVPGKTPYELWFNKRAVVDNLRVFGAKVYTHIPKEKRQKWDEKSQEGVFVGYTENNKSFRVWRAKNDKIDICRDIIFRESDQIVFPQIHNDDLNYLFVFHDGSAGCQDTNLNLNYNFNEIDNVNETESNSGSVSNSVENNLSNTNIENSNIIDLNVNNSNIDIIELDDSISRNELSNTISENSIIDSFVSLDSSDESENIENRESDIIANRLRDRNFLPRPNYKERESQDFNETLMLAQCFEPLSYEEAKNCEDSEKWIEAMDNEIDSLKENNTWTLVNLPEGRKAISNKWVYRVKLKTSGELERYKARLVIRGFSQQYGVDYNETFSAVVKFSSIRMILSIAAAEQLVLKQFDVKTAFLYGDLNEEIYMLQPTGYDDKSGKVCRLNRSLYGLKQASRCWNQKFTSFLKNFGFETSKADSCVFISNKTGNIMILAIYIDDGLVAAKCEADICELLNFLGKTFQIKSGNLECFLGLEIESEVDGSIYIHQTSYAKKILSKFQMDQSVPVSTPMDQHHAMSSINYPDEMNEAVNVPYREAVGSLMYLAVGTRPDISYALSVASQYMEKPMMFHWTAVKRIFKYLNGSANKGIVFGNNININLKCYSDADYAGDVDTRRSTSGYVSMIGSGAISWCSQRQRMVSLSTTESEYVAASQALKELVWLHRLFLEIVPSKNDCIPKLYVDNQSAIKLIKNPEFHKRTKHIDVRYHFIREKFEDGFFELMYIPTKDQIADVFTKALPKIQFNRLRHMMGIN